MAKLFEGKVALVTGGASSGIRVNAVCSGGVLTPMLEPLLEAEPHMREAMKKMHPLRRIGKPEEIAAAVICRERGIL